MLPLEERTLFHPYSDAEACHAKVVVHPLEEMLAEKCVRSSVAVARDVYGLWFLLKHHAKAMNLKAARRALEEKSRYKGYP